MVGDLHIHIAKLAFHAKESHPDTGAVFGLRIFTAHQSGPWPSGRTPKDPLVQDSSGIPKLILLVVLEFYLGVPWASPRLGSCHSLFHSPSNLYPKLENFTTQNSTENLISSVSTRK